MNIRSHQRGELNILLVPFIFMTIFFIAAASFGAWAYMERQDYKDNVDKKVSAAVAAARKDEDIQKDKAFAESEKKPLLTYKGPDTYGGIMASYPKTWSVYIGSTTTPSQPLNAYFNPVAVPSTGDADSVYALRMQVVQQTYDTVIKSFSTEVKAAKVTAVPFALPKVPDVVGTRFDGLISAGKKTTGSMLVLPLRDKTMEIWTESPEFTADFNNTIIPNLSFSP